MTEHWNKNDIVLSQYDLLRQQNPLLFKCQCENILKYFPLVTNPNKCFIAQEEMGETFIAPNFFAYSCVKWLAFRNHFYT